MASVNLWRDLLGTLPQSVTEIVLVVTLNGDGRTCVVQYPNGSQVVAYGQAVSAAAFAFLRDGQIIGPAPAGSPVTADV